MQKAWGLVVVGLVLAILATLGSVHWLLVVVLHVRMDYAELSLDVLKEVGVAFFIAGTAILSIEQARVKTFTEELGVEVRKKLDAIEVATTDLVYRGPLPRKYYEKIKDDMLSPRFVRHKWDFHLEISWLDGLDFLEFRFQQEYEIENVDSSARHYAVSHFESCDWDWDPRFANTTRIDYLRIYLAGASFSEEKAPPGATLGESEAEFIKVERKVELPLKNILRVEEGSTKIMSARHLETRMIAEPTMDLRMYVRYPADLKVEIDLPHVLLGNEDFKQVSDETLRDGKRETYWHVSRPLAPLTFFNIVWRKVQPSPSATKQPATAPAAIAPAQPATAPAAIAPVQPATPAPPPAAMEKPNDQAAVKPPAS